MRDVVILEQHTNEDGSFVAVAVLRAAVPPGVTKGQQGSADENAPSDELEALASGTFIERVVKTGVFPKGAEENMLRDFDAMLNEFRADIAKKYESAPETPTLVGAARAANGDWLRKDGSKIERKTPVQIESPAGPAEAEVKAAQAKVAKPKGLQ